MFNKKNDKSSCGSFFLVVPIGLEDRAAQELNEWAAVLATEFGNQAYLQRVEKVKGGVEFEVGVEVGLLFNQYLKIPSRILQRVHQFTTREWAEVEKEFRKISWNQFFPQGIQEWEIAASESRMNNEKHLAQFLQEKIEGPFYARSVEGCKAYLRVYNNQFVVSRDTSGEHLHFRGYRKKQGEAPLRENLAAFLWSFLLQHQSRREAEAAVLVDPYVGSGTLLFEALLWNQRIRTRTFVSQGWLSANSLQRIKAIDSRLESWSLTGFGVDLNKEMIEKAHLNERSLKIENSLEKDRYIVSPNALTWITEDSTQSDRTPSWLPQDRPIWLLSNPPYGGKGRLKTHQSWRYFWEKALLRYKPSWAVAVGPERECAKGESLQAWKCIETRRFLNGGIRVAASVWKRSF